MRITSVFVGKVPLKGAFDGSHSESADPLLAIEVEIRNTSRTSKVQYRTFMGPDISFTRDYATLRDNFDNIYKRIDFGFASRPARSTESESIYPGKAITDVLVFEPPVYTVEYLNLELPAQNFGGTGMLRIRIAGRLVVWPDRPTLAVPERHEAHPAAPPTESSIAKPQTPVCAPNRSGDVEVSLTSAAIARVSLIGASSGREFQSSVRYLRIEVKITNRGSGLVDFSTWRTARVLLRDDRGKVCSLHDFGSAYSISGSVGAKSLVPGESVTDVLVFDRPGAGFTWLTLELPAIAFGADADPIRFEVPADRIKR